MTQSGREPTFWGWLRRQQDRMDGVGDLARFVARDRLPGECAAGGWQDTLVVTLRTHLRDQHGIMPGTAPWRATGRASSEYDRYLAERRTSPPPHRRPAYALDDGEVCPGGDPAA